jgi:hypothetical protein
MSDMGSPRVALMQAMRRVYSAQAAVGEVLAQQWPVGCPITWERGGHLHTGIVRNLSVEHVLVCNDKTEKTYWVSAYNVLRADSRIADQLFDRVDTTAKSES